MIEWLIQIANAMLGRWPVEIFIISPLLFAVMYAAFSCPSIMFPAVVKLRQSADRSEPTPPPSQSDPHPPGTPETPEPD